MPSSPFEDMPPVEYIEFELDLAKVAADESRKFQQKGNLDAAMTSMLAAFEMAGGTPEALPERSRFCVEAFRRWHDEDNL